MALKITGFLKVHNEAENGNLWRCIVNLRDFCDEILVGDDGSEDYPILYDEITDFDCNFIRWKTNDWKDELRRKQIMLDFCKSLDTDVVFWLDADEIASKPLVKNIRNIAEQMIKDNIDGVSFHNINLWKSEKFYRIDERYDDGWFVRLWNATKPLKFNVSYGLHKQQYPENISNVIKSEYKIINFGFSTYDLIKQKYEKYKELGQIGWELQRLDPEKDGELKEVNPNWF